MSHTGAGAHEAADARRARVPPIGGGVDHHPNRAWCAGLVRRRSLTSLYRMLCLAVAGADALLFYPAQEYAVPAPLLFSGVVAYSLFKVLHPWGWYLRRTIALACIVADAGVCASLLWLTDGLTSPFVAYSLMPALTAGLLMQKSTALAVAGMLAASGTAAHVCASFFRPEVSHPGLGYPSVYAIAVLLAATLPSLVNLTFRRRLEVEDTVQERRRLSREIHDEVVQNAAAVRWQAQCVRQRLLQMGVKLKEVSDLLMIADRSERDARESLELLNECTNTGSVVSHLREQLARMNRAGDTRHHLQIEARAPDLEPGVEIQLLRICQEALNNVRRHAAARNAWVKVKALNNTLALSITDDGCGFDGSARRRQGDGSTGYGIEAMQERADSIGAALTVTSAPERGTEIRVELPLAPGGRR